MGKGGKQFAACLLVLALAGCGGRQAPDGYSEKLSPQIPKGFVEGFQHSDSNGTITEYVPQGQTVEDWNEMITVQYLPVKGVSPEKFYYGMGALATKACDNFSMDRPISANGAGYPLIRGATYCGTNKMTGRGEFTNYSIIQGKTGMFLLQRASRLPPFTTSGEVMKSIPVKDWASFFNNSRFCFSGSTENGCVTI